MILRSGKVVGQHPAGPPSEEKNNDTKYAFNGSKTVGVVRGHGEILEKRESSPSPKGIGEREVRGMKSLPLELLIKIFGYLDIKNWPALQGTCKQFNTVCKMPSVVRSHIVKQLPYPVERTSETVETLGNDQYILNKLNDETDCNWAKYEPFIRFGLAVHLKIISFCCLNTLGQAQEGRMGEVLSLVAFGGGQLASGSFDGTIKIWGQNQQGEWCCLKTLGQAQKGHRHWVRSLVALGGGRFASGSMDCTIKIWGQNQQEEWCCLKTLGGTQGEHRHEVCSLVVLDGGQLASGSIDWTIKRWGPDPDWCYLDTVKGHWSWVWSLVAIGGGQFASGSGDWAIKIWGPDWQGKCRCLMTLREHSNEVLSLVAIGGGQFASGSLDQTIKIWGWGYQKEIRQESQ